MYKMLLDWLKLVTEIYKPWRYILVPSKLCGPYLIFPNLICTFCGSKHARIKIANINKWNYERIGNSIGRYKLNI
jgi:hypothetical protein